MPVTFAPVPGDCMTLEELEDHGTPEQWEQHRQAVANARALAPARAERDRWVKRYVATLAKVRADAKAEIEAENAAAAAKGEGVQVGGGDDEEGEKKRAYGRRRANGLVGPAGCVCEKRGRKKPFEALARDRRTGTQVSVGCYATMAEARAALRVEQAAFDAMFEETDEAFQAGLEDTQGLDPSPDDPKDAEFGKTYRHQSPKNKFVPYGAVVGRAGNQGLGWFSACTHVDPVTGAKWTCGQKAIAAKPGEPARFCQSHGARCSHGARWHVCRECNPNAENNAENCGVCAKLISRNRLARNGGTGHCGDCQEHLNAQAAAAGAAPLPKGKTTEDVCKDYLLPRVVDKEGKQIYATLLDDFKNMLGTFSKDSGKRTRDSDGECQTFTKRRPDALWLLFNSDRRIIAVICLEIDEHSHPPSRNYTSSCEVGKVEDTFQSILKITQELGKSRFAYFSRDHKYTPCVQIIKINPDECDCKPHVRRNRRLDVAAEMISDLLNTPPEHYEALSADGQANMPHVRCLYYHSKSPHLPYFAEKTVGAWDWQGNACPE